MKLSLPFPPGANALWRKGGGRIYSTDELREFKRAVKMAGMVEGVSPLEGAVFVSLAIYAPNHRLDSDAPIKATLDALQGVAYLNDRQVVGGQWQLFLDRANPRVVVTVEPTAGLPGRTRKRLPERRTAPKPWRGKVPTPNVVRPAREGQ